MNQLKMDIQSIQTLTGLSWSQCKIARELRIDRETVARYRRIVKLEEDSNPNIPPPDRTQPPGWICRKGHLPWLTRPPQNQPFPPPAGAVCASVFRELIVAKFELDLTANCSVVP